MTIKPLLTGLVFLAGLFYMGSIINAGIISLSGEGSLNPLFSNAIIVIGGILSTNLGAVLGYTFTPPAKAAKASLPKPFIGLRSTVKNESTTPRPGPMGPGNEPESTDQGNSPNQKAQVFACYFYIISLVIALVFYMIASGKGGTPQSVIEELSKTLLGVLVGGLTVSLMGKQS
jgi:hypothetical protein